MALEKKNRKIINFYCDESCHLENDKQPIMLIGGIWCPEVDVYGVSKDIRKIKHQHNANGEIKWTKVSNSRIEFFSEYIQVWEYEESKNRIRTYFWLEKFDYLIVIEEKENVYWLVTAYYVDSDYQRKKLKRKYKNRIKNNRRPHR